MIEIAAKSEGRVVEKKRRGKGLRATFVQLAFESPTGSPSGHELGEIIES